MSILYEVWVTRHDRPGARYHAMRRLFWLPSAVILHPLGDPQVPADYYWRYDKCEADAILARLRECVASGSLAGWTLHAGEAA